MSIFARNQNALTKYGLTKTLFPGRENLLPSKKIATERINPKIEKHRSTVDHDQLTFIILSEDDVTNIINTLNLDPQELLATNQLTKVEQILPGDLLIIPGWTIVKYMVRAGDTITGLSQRFNISLSILMRINCLAPNSLLQAGQVIFLPEPC
ncbi:MAG TPA: hypothetical protein DEB05_00380 [Firmicutes bacterium]|jgi:hypothetical protein|nr:hypothetical protein [Bacillota bacterium]